MNVFAWSRPHQLAVFVAALIGVAGGVLVGYVVYALGMGSNAVMFSYWIQHPVRESVFEWGLFGGLSAGATAAVARVLLYSQPG